MKKLVALLFFASTVLSAQVEAPQPSPLAKMEQVVGLTNVTVTYSRPSMRGRTIFGGLIPYNELWRTGANQNTTISFSDDVKVNGKALKKGSYAVYTKPGEEKWEVYFYEDTSNWGLPKEWDDQKVAASVTADVTDMPFEMETFTMVIDELSNTSATLSFLWETSVASVKITVPTDEKAMASIDKTMKANPTANDYYAAANYYYEADKDQEQALEWMNKSISMNEDTPFYILRKKALIQAKLGMTDEAIKTAKESLEKAEKAGNSDYVKMNKASIKAWSN